jgi:hypothetical protein
MAAGFKIQALTNIVMRGLDPRIQAIGAAPCGGLDGRIKSGHDGNGRSQG